MAHTGNGTTLCKSLLLKPSFTFIYYALTCTCGSFNKNKTLRESLSYFVVTSSTVAISPLQNWLIKVKNLNTKLLKKSVSMFLRIYFITTQKSKRHTPLGSKLWKKTLKFSKIRRNIEFWLMILNSDLRFFLLCLA